MSVSRNKIKKGLFYAAASLAAFTLLLPFLVQLGLNSAPVKQKIVSLAAQKAGMEIQPEKIDFKVRIGLKGPVIHFGLKDTVVSLNSSLHIKIKAAWIEFDAKALISGKIIPMGIRLDTPKILLVQGNQSPHNRETELKSPKWLTSLRLEEKQIQKLFALMPKDLGNIDLALNNLKSDYFHSVNGTIRVSKPDQIITLDLNAHQMNIGARQLPEISVLRDMRIRSIEAGTLRLMAELAGKGGIKGNMTLGNLVLSSQGLGKHKVETGMIRTDFAISDKSWAFTLHPVPFAYPQGMVGMNFGHDMDTGKTRIAFKGDKIQINQARQASLALGSRSRLVRQLFEILRAGTTQEIRVVFEHKSLDDLFEADDMVLRGSVKQGSVKIPKTPVIVSDIDGTAFIQKGVLQVNAKSGNLAGSRVSQGWLDLDLLNYEDSPFKGEFNFSADLSGVPSTLISLLPGTVLANELKKIQQVSGRADTRLILGMDTGEKDIQVDVRASNISGLALYDRIPLNLSISNGVFSYKDQQAVLCNVEGRVGNNPVENLCAAIDVSQTTHLTIRSFKGRLHTRDFTDWIKSFDPVMELIAPVRDALGQIEIQSLTLDGPFFNPKHWRYHAKGTVRDMNLTIGSSNNSVRNLETRYDLSDKGARIQGLKAHIHEITWLSDRYDIKKLQSIKMPFRLCIENAELGPEENKVSGNLEFKPEIFLGFDLFGHSPNHLHPISLEIRDNHDTKAWLGFNHKPDAPFLHFKGFFNSNILENLLNQDSHLHQQVQSFTKGQPIKIHTQKDKTLHVDFGHLNLEEVIEKFAVSGKGQNRPLFSPGQVLITAPSLDYKGQRFSNLATRLSFTDSGPVIDIVHLSLCDLEFSGSIGLVNQGAGPPHAHLSLDISAHPGEDKETELACLFKEKRLIQGPYSFSCKLEGNGPLDKLFQAFEGRLDFYSENGRIYKATLLSRVLSVINILSLPDLSQEGFAYHSFNVKGLIKEGKILLEKAVIDGENMALTFSGWLSPFEDDMNLTCLVAPFKTIDTIIKYIPVIGTAFRGRLISFPAKATGSLSDPVVTPLHPSAVGTGLINMMTDIIKTPIRLFQGKIE